MYERHVLDYYAIHCGPLLDIVPAKVSNPALPKKKTLFLRLMMSVILPLMEERESENGVVAFSSFSPCIPTHR